VAAPDDILRSHGVAFAVHEHVPVSSVAEILVALPFPADEHVKTLAFDADGRVALAAVRGGDRLQYGKLARALGVARDRIAPLPPERVRGELGLEPGGVCPLVDRPGVPVLVDRRVLDLPRAFCGSGRNTATLELAPADLVRASGAVVVDIAQDHGQDAPA
jgi:Cys-tRNA(Pro)/Cys-tRNA(Cys) deacylase